MDFLSFRIRNKKMDIRMDESYVSFSFESRKIGRVLLNRVIFLSASRR